jgi:hypothetical protein
MPALAEGAQPAKPVARAGTSSNAYLVTYAHADLCLMILPSPAGHNLESTWLVAETVDYLRSIHAISPALAKQYRQTVMSIGAAAVRDGFDTQHGGIFESGQPSLGPQSKVRAHCAQCCTTYAILSIIAVSATVAQLEIGACGQIVGALILSTAASLSRVSLHLAPKARWLCSWCPSTNCDYICE